MEIEKAFSFWIDRTARMMKNFASTKARELGLGITIDQWVLLAMVAENENISQQELGDQTFKDKASVARISEILGKKGFIVRMRNTANRREYKMTITKSGLEKVTQLLPHVQKARKIGTRGFKKSEIRTLVHLLQRVHRNYENALQKSN